MEELSLPLVHVRKLLGAGNGDAALYYLYLRTGAAPDPEQDAKTLRIPTQRLSAALTLLRQLGLVAPEKQPRYIAPAEPAPVGDEELRRRLEKDADFKLLVGEVQRQLGRILSTEELRILAGITGYLGLPAEVVGVILTYCMQRAAERGANPPSMLAVQRTAYRWAEDGIDTLEQASAYLQTQLGRSRAMAQLNARMKLGRSFRAPEETKLQSWMELGFGAREIYYAYERCVLSTGDLNWNYMDKIIRSWHEKGLHTLARIKELDVKPAAAKTGPATSADAPGALERDMVARLRAAAKEEEN